MRRICIISSYIKARGGNKDVQEFLALSDKQLQFLLEDKKNDYLQDRAVREKKWVHQEFDTVIKGSDL